MPDLAKWLERLIANAEVPTVLGSIPASSDTVESEERQMKQCWIKYIEEKNQQIQCWRKFCSEEPVWPLESETAEDASEASSNASSGDSGGGSFGNSSCRDASELPEEIPEVICKLEDILDEITPW